MIPGGGRCVKGQAESGMRGSLGKAVNRVEPGQRTRRHKPVRRSGRTAESSTGHELKICTEKEIGEGGGLSQRRAARQRVVDIAIQ
jgi:hypothetical protein